MKLNIKHIIIIAGCIGAALLVAFFLMTEGSVDLT